MSSSGVEAGGGWCSCLQEGKPLPRHVAIIPDGNRRWARRRGLPVWRGHAEGYRAARRVLDALWALGVNYVTFYALSRENCLRRSPAELERIHGLLSLAAEELEADPRVESGRVRVFFAGDLSLLPGWLAERLEAVNAATRGNGPDALAVGVCYGGRWEVLEAARRLAAGGLVEVDEESFRGLMPLGWMPEPDLVIRTGGERRLSGFLLYHVAYSELYFTDVLWPDFGVSLLCRALCWFQGRERRFGR